MKDIRRYFGGTAGKSALTELRDSHGSPQRTSRSNQNVQKRPKKISKTLSPDILLSEASDEENPIPRSVRKELAKKKSKKRIVISSDDEDDLPPSVSQARPPKNTKKVSSKMIEKISPRKRENKPKKSPVKRRVSVTSDEEMELSDDLDQFMPALPMKRKRRTPPGQTKLDVNTNAATVKKKDSPKRKSAKIVPELEIIDPVEFFQNFGKSSEAMKKNMNKNDGFEKTKSKSSKKFSTNLLSPSASSKKSTFDSSPEIDRIISSTKDDENSRSPSRAQKKSIKRPKKLTEKEIVEEIVSPKKKEAEKKVKSTDKTKIDNEKKAGTLLEKAMSKKFKGEQKSPKSKNILELKDSGNIDQLSEKIGIAFEEGMNLPWVDKYKPCNLKQLVGQNGEKSPMNKLLSWLREWSKNHLGEGGKQKKARPPPWLAQSDGTAFKAVMLSGPPGVGKTTCAVMACKELGLRFVEKNASDVRNKKILEAQTSELIDSQQMDGFFGDLNTQKAAHKSNEITHVLIMDEVDGMSGNDDRAGIAELIQMIKETRIPIICICNDRQSQKMRSLVNYCFDLRFQRPRVEQIRARLLTIACQEQCKIEKEEIDEIIEASQHDVRQSIYNLQLLSSSGKEKLLQRKDAAINPFEAARRLLNSDTPLWEKQQMFFVDYSIMPLFVQENYPFVQNSKMSVGERLSALKKAANSISRGDIVDRTIRTTGAWTLLNEQALFSSVVPTSYMNGYMKGMINFPSWLGKNSTANKRQRLLRQLTMHSYLKTFSNTYPMVLDYISSLRHHYCRPLLDRENDGVSDVVEMYKEYNLVRDDTDAIAELAVWPGMDDPGAAIPVKVKATLTRTLNKEHILLPYALDTLTKGRTKATGNNDLALQLDEEGHLVELGGGENDMESSDGDSDDEDVSSGVTKKKAVNIGESGKTRGGRGRGGNSRGAGRASRGAARGRGGKK